MMVQFDLFSPAESIRSGQGLTRGGGSVKGVAAFFFAEVK
jgi:hypothetical protein